MKITKKQIIDRLENRSVIKDKEGFIYSKEIDRLEEQAILQLDNPFATKKENLAETVNFIYDKINH